MGDLTIAEIGLRNWKCYRGEQRLHLEAKAYGVFAREVGNPDRSNFLGKSSIIEAIDYALTGRLPEDAHRKIDVISRGEKSMEVDLLLSDGSRIKRSQTLTGSERIYYFPPNEPTKGATQAKAQEAIDALVGLGAKDLEATRLFRQGDMARLVKLDPGPRLDLVAGWLRLEKLQECEDAALSALREVWRRRDAAYAQVNAANEEAAKYVAGAGGVAKISKRK